MKLENTPLHHSFYVFQSLEVYRDIHLSIEKINMQIHIISIINTTVTDVELFYCIQHAQYACHLYHGPC